MIYPCITLYQPWATWITRGWKTIETRTHDRFASLKGKVILIHAGQKTDGSDYAVRNPYLTFDQIIYNPDEMVNGALLCSAVVYDFRKLNDSHSKAALIECRSDRWGLFLSNVEPFEDPMPVKGEMGIWYFDLQARAKVKKQTLQMTLF